MRGSSSIKKIMPAGKPMKGNNIPIAAAAFGASGDAASAGRIEAAGAMLGTDVGPALGLVFEGVGGASGMALSGRLHCQQAGDAGKLFAPQ